MKDKSSAQIKKPKIKARTLAPKQKIDPNRQRTPPQSWWYEILPSLLEKWNAFGAHLGYKVTNKVTSKKLSLVIHTTSKGIQQQESMMIPEMIFWQDGSHTYSLITDVIRCSKSFDLHKNVVFGPGDTASYSDYRSTIGAVVYHESGRCLLTVGHLLNENAKIGDTVVAIASNIKIKTKLVDYKINGSIDYAILLPNESINIDNLVQDLIRIGPIYTPTQKDIKTKLWLVKRDGNFYETKCKGVNARLIISPNEIYTNVILTNLISEPGDSGGVLVDSDNRVWGFLLGVHESWSVFVPSYMVLNAANVDLV